MKKYFNRLILFLFYGIRFPKGYEFVAWECNGEDKIIEYLHNEKISLGWEKHCDIFFYFGKCRMIYKRLIK